MQYSSSGSGGSTTKQEEEEQEHATNKNSAMEAEEATADAVPKVGQQQPTSAAIGWGGAESESLDRIQTDRINKKS